MTLPDTDTTVDIPFLDWNEFLQRVFVWKQGEHIGVIGPTGQGKTTLSMALLPMRRFVTLFATKPRDRVISGLRQRGYIIIRRWVGMTPTLYPRRILWPKARNLYAKQHQQEVFTEAMARIYDEGAWTLYLDELWYMTQELRMSHEIKTYLLQARSLNISIVASSQRPRWIPLELFDQSTHLFFFRDNDIENLRRISGIGFLNAQTIRWAVANLERYETLYINTRSGDMIRTMAPEPVE